MNQFTSDTSTEITQNQRLMELIAAEDAASSQVGCSRVANANFLDIIENKSISIDNENFRDLLRSHLGHLLAEVDFDFIISKVNRYIHKIILSVDNDKQQVQFDAEIVEHIPEQELRQLLQVELEQVELEQVELEQLSIDAVAQIIKYTQLQIHLAVLQPRHTWLPPIWLLKSEQKFYIAQAASLETAIALVKAQHPQVIGELEVVKVGGVLAPNQVIDVDVNQLLP